MAGLESRQLPSSLECSALAKLVIHEGAPKR
jgi:hypothetical protein